MTDLTGNPLQPDIAPGQIWEHNKRKDRYIVESTQGRVMHKGRDGVWRETVHYRAHPYVNKPGTRHSVWSRDFDMFRSDFSYVEGP